MRSFVVKRTMRWKSSRRQLGPTFFLILFRGTTFLFFEEMACGCQDDVSLTMTLPMNSRRAGCNHSPISFPPNANSGGSDWEAQELHPVAWKGARGGVIGNAASDTHIYRSVGWEAEEFEKLVSDQQKDRSKTELEKNFFAFPTDFIYILCILSSLEFHLVVFISKQQAATRTWWASTEPWQRRPRFVRRRRRKTPWPSRTTVIHKRGKGWSQIFKRNMST